MPSISLPTLIASIEASGNSSLLVELIVLISKYKLNSGTSDILVEAALDKLVSGDSFSADPDTVKASRKAETLSDLPPNCPALRKLVSTPASRGEERVSKAFKSNTLARPKKIFDKNDSFQRDDEEKPKFERQRNRVCDTNAVNRNTFDTKQEGILLVQKLKPRLKFPQSFFVDLKGRYPIPFTNPDTAISYIKEHFGVPIEERKKAPVDDEEPVKGFSSKRKVFMKPAVSDSEDDAPSISKKEESDDDSLKARSKNKRSKKTEETDSEDETPKKPAFRKKTASVLAATSSTSASAASASSKKQVETESEDEVPKASKKKAKMPVITFNDVEIKSYEELINHKFPEEFTEVEMKVNGVPTLIYTIGKYPENLKDIFGMTFEEIKRELASED